MSLRYRLVTGLLKAITSALCRIDDRQVVKVPPAGPLILVVNHVNILDVPVVYTRLRPRPLTAFVKVEAWENPIERGLLGVWGGIPLHRGQADFPAFRQGLEMLEKGYIVAVAPEGTRNSDGRLIKAQPGVVLLALRSGAPVLPLVYYGHEHVWQNLKKLRRSAFNFVVGRPFRIVLGTARANSQVTQQIVTEVMYQLAALLPEQYRGNYADLEHATTQYLSFLPQQEKSTIAA